jgi:undecaprenyl-diphosphatase
MNLLQRMNEKEMTYCLMFNRLNHRRLIGLFFSLISRLGDGVFWYSIMLILPFIYPENGWLVTIQMVLTGLLSLILYRFLKTRTERERPCSVSNQILQGMPALDQFSFPSGHTMHAVGFSWILLSHYPAWAPLILAFTTLVALSRLILGLHYPSDVLVGAAIGSSIAGGIMLMY